MGKAGSNSTPWEHSADISPPSQLNLFQLHFGPMHLRIILKTWKTHDCKLHTESPERIHTSLLPPGMAQGFIYSLQTYELCTTATGWVNVLLSAQSMGEAMLGVIALPWEICRRKGHKMYHLHNSLISTTLTKPELLKSQIKHQGWTAGTSSALVGTTSQGP